MDTNTRIEGIGRQVRGAVMESLGIAIGDAKLAADGGAERALGDAQNSASAGGDQLMGIDTDRILGIGHQIKGALLEELGRLVGNPKLQATGTAERDSGKAQNVAGGDRDLARQTAEKQHPVADANLSPIPPEGELKSWAAPKAVRRSQSACDEGR